MPLEIAKQHPLYGVGGWLILVAIGIIATPVRMILEIGPIYSAIDFSNLHPMLFAVILGELTINAALVLWSLANMFLLLSKHRMFPTSWIGQLAVAAVLGPLSLFATDLALDSIGQHLDWSQLAKGGVFTDMFRALIAAAIWIPYALLSTRVGITFLNRVRVDDPLLKRAIQQVF